MIDHISLNVSDITTSKEFYLKALEPLGYKTHMEMPEWNLLGLGREKPDFWILAAGCKQTTHLAFTADSKEMVDAFHQAGVAAGGKDNGAPGYRKEYSPGYYGAFVLDPDGHNLEAVYHDTNPSE